MDSLAGVSVLVRFAYKSKGLFVLVLCGHYGSAAPRLQPTSLQDQAHAGAASPRLPGALLATWQREAM